jgi:calcineurin-like phosphoesterase family protein
MSNVWFISDLHFFHKRICEYSGRPYSSVEEMNEALIINWNSVVKPTDTVWDLGDFSFGDIKQTKEVLSKLNGKHNIVLGNHDKIIIQHRNELIAEKLFESIQDYKELKYNNEHIILFHFAMRVWNKSHHGAIHLWGHSHGSLSPHGLSVDVGVDSKEITSEYRPVSIDEVLEYMKHRTKSVVDHHK